MKRFNNVDAESITMEPVTKIPNSSWVRRKGVSKYDKIVGELTSMPVNAPVQVKCPHVQMASLYSSLAELMKLRKMKNIRLVTRGQKLYAERLF